MQFFREYIELKDELVRRRAIEDPEFEHSKSPAEEVTVADPKLKHCANRAEGYIEWILRYINILTKDWFEIADPTLPKSRDVRHRLHALEKTPHYAKGKLFAQWIDEKKVITRLRDLVFLFENVEFEIGCVRSSVRVYLGYHMTEGFVAVKRLNKDDESVQYERQILRDRYRYTFTRVVRLYFFYERNQKFNYIVMELCKYDLPKYLALRTDLSLRKRFDLIMDLLIGLKEMHDKGYVHRNVIPNNMLISFDRNKLKLSDFSVSLNLKKCEKITSTDGSINWKCPEVHEKVYKAHDLQNAFLILYYILTGEPPLVKHLPANSGRSEISNDKLFEEFLRNPNFPGRLELFKEYDLFEKVVDQTKLSFFLRTCVQDTFTRWQKRGEKDVNIIIDAFDKIYRIRDAGERDLRNEIYERTCCTREAILLSHGVSGTSDLAVIEKALDECGFNRYAWSDMDNNIDITTGLFKVEISNLAIRIDQDKNIDRDTPAMLFLHVSAHGAYVDDVHDTVLMFKDGSLSIRQMLNFIYEKMDEKNINCKVIFTVDACRERQKLSGEFPKRVTSEKEYVVFYSVGVGKLTPLLEQAAYSSAFSSALAWAIKPATLFQDIVNEVKTDMKNEGYIVPTIEFENREILDKFVF